jgi:hypothetical protein
MKVWIIALLCFQFNSCSEATDTSMVLEGTWSFCENNSYFEAFFEGDYMFAYSAQTGFISPFKYEMKDDSLFFFIENMQEFVWVISGENEAGFLMVDEIGNNFALEKIEIRLQKPFTFSSLDEENIFWDGFLLRAKENNCK